MIRTIMVPLDISSSDDVVIKYAVELAKNFDSQIVFFKTYHKTEFTYPVSGMASIMPSDRTLDNIEEGFRNEKLEYLNNNFPELYNIEFELIINSGSTVDFLAEADKDIKPDLLVIGTSGVSGLEEIFGTKAEKLTREAPCPVMVIPDELAAYKRIRKIGLALDVDYVDNDLHLDILFGMAKNLSAMLEIVNVSESIDDADIHHNKIYSRIRQETNNSVNYYTIRILLKEDEEKALSEYIDKNHIDLLVLVYREHGFFKRVFNPGLRKRLISNINIPLLILK